MLGLRSLPASPPAGRLPIMAFLHLAVPRLTSIALNLSISPPNPIVFAMHLAY